MQDIYKAAKKQRKRKDIKEIERTESKLPRRCEMAFKGEVRGLI